VLLLPPAFRTPPHLVDPTGALEVWLTEPAGMLDHAAPGTVFTAKLATWLTGEATDAMLELAAKRGDERFTFVHDWRGVTSHESAARIKVIDWGRRLGRRIRRIDIALASDASPLFRMAVAGGTMAMSVVGIPCFSWRTIDEAVARAKVRPAGL
jgi:hypothetical protein